MERLCQVQLHPVKFTLLIEGRKLNFWWFLIRLYSETARRRPNAVGTIGFRVLHVQTTSSAAAVSNQMTRVLVKAVRGMNVQICTKASNLVHRYILTCWTQICREPTPIFNGVAILDDSKWPPSENTFLHFLPTNSHRITKNHFSGGFGTKEPNSDMWMPIALTMGGPIGCFKMATIKIHILAYLTNKKW